MGINKAFEQQKDQASDLNQFMSTKLGGFSRRLSIRPQNSKESILEGPSDKVGQSRKMRP